MGGVKYIMTNASFRITFWFRIGCYLKEKRNWFHKILYGIVFLIHKQSIFNRHTNCFWDSNRLRIDF